MKSVIDNGAVLSAAVVGDYMRAAIAEIDRQFSDGFAANNPVLLAGFIQAIAIEREGSGIRQWLEIK